jgi:ribonuclease HII
MLEYEKKYYDEGIMLVAGVDEAGRGPLAGPVCVASVIMPQDSMIEEINDSKKLSEKKREKLYDEIINTALCYHIELIDNKIIDDINILNATKLGMKKCIESLEIVPEIAIIDAVKIDTEIPTDSLVRGDALSYNVAAASILAKVTRDRLMIELDEKYPEYNFKKHKGYGTKEHIEALKKYGKCDIHRDSFIGNFVGK